MTKYGFTRPLIRRKEVMFMDIAIARESAFHDFGLSDSS
jgi:hypothetical protein